MEQSWIVVGILVVKPASLRGADSGIGAQVSLLLAESGAKVVLVDRDEVRMNSITLECLDIASVAGCSISLIGGAHFASSKHAVIGLTRHMARELCNQGIRANAFCPGATYTPMIHNNMNAEDVEGLKQRIPLGRLAESDEQARVVAYMLSDAASYINGACLDSNGGSVIL